MPDPTEHPPRIDVSESVYAVRLGNHYRLVFPRDRAASASVKRWKGAHWAPECGGWMMDMWRVDTIRKALNEVKEILDGRHGAGALPPVQRLIMAIDDAPEVGQEVDVDGVACQIESLGRVFPASRALASTRPELKGRLVCYAYLKLAPEPAAPVETVEAAPLPDEDQDLSHEF